MHALILVVAFITFFATSGVARPQDVQLWCCPRRSGSSVLTGQSYNRPRLQCQYSSSTTCVYNGITGCLTSGPRGACPHLNFKRPFGTCPAPVCTPTGDPCDINNPGACCSQTCGVVQGKSGYYCY